jgi:hypothetical protein
MSKQKQKADPRTGPLCHFCSLLITKGQPVGIAMGELAHSACMEALDHGTLPKPRGVYMGTGIG